MVVLTGTGCANDEPSPLGDGAVGVGTGGAVGNDGRSDDAGAADDEGISGGSGDTLGDVDAGGVAGDAGIPTANEDGRTSSDGHVGSSADGDGGLGRDGSNSDGDAAMAADSAPVTVIDANVTPDVADALVDLPGEGPCRATPSHPVTSVNFAGLTYDADTSPVYVVPNGFRVSGTVELPELPSGTQVYDGFVEAVDVVSGTVFTSKPGAATPRGFVYGFVAPAGSYRMTYQLAINGSTDVLIRNKFETVQLCGDTEHNVGLDAIGTLVRSTTTVDGLDKMGPAHSPLGYEVTVTLTSPDHTLVASGVAYADKSALVAMNIPTSVQSYTPNIVVTDSMGVGGNSLDFKANIVSGAPPYVVGVPDVVWISGAVADASRALTSAISHGECLSADGDEFPNQTLHSNVEQSRGYFNSTTLSFLYWMPKGITCTPFVYGFIDTGAVAGAPPAVLEIPESFGAAPQPLTENIIQRFTLPAVAPVLSLSPTVRDIDGHPLADYDVTYSSSNLAAPALKGDQFHVTSSVTGSDGHAGVRILPGTYSQVAVRLH